MKCTLEVNIDDDVLRASGMSPETYLRRIMGSLQEYGIRLILPLKKERREGFEDPGKQKKPPELGQ